MSRKSARTDITVDRFWPVDVISKLATEAGVESKKDLKKRYKSIVIRLDALQAMRTIIALQRILEQLEKLEDKVSLTIYVDENSTNESLRMTITSAGH